MDNIANRLKQAGIENAAREADWIVRYNTGGMTVDEIVKRRIGGEPLQYLLGEWEFYGYPFKVGKGVLIPRPETELLVDLAKKHNPETVLDLCAGTGCVGIALAKETGCNVIAAEKSEAAITYLKTNISLNKVEGQVKVIQGDILDADTIKRLSTFDYRHIVINPPYLNQKEMQTLQKEVTHEPKIALYGGEDGFDFYRAFFALWKYMLKRSRLFACEVGDGQAEAVCRLMKDKGIPGLAKVEISTKKDFNGIKRIVHFCQN
ncbi:MAG: peptide chain release factor N(5)-glutamine methyltransferase [Oscillospiraceae bacterium]|nr:peptide chain release factor N(5)-glutamine methyltransferase [Oscillospiraceae bacterium]